MLKLISESKALISSFKYGDKINCLFFLYKETYLISFINKINCLGKQNMLKSIIHINNQF